MADDDIDPRSPMPLPFSFVDFETDPYSCAINGMRILIRTALTLDDTMNDTESQNLVAIEELIRRLDNA